MIKRGAEVSYAKRNINIEVREDLLLFSFLFPLSRIFPQLTGRG